MKHMKCLCRLLEIYYLLENWVGKGVGDGKRSFFPALLMVALSKETPSAHLKDELSKFELLSFVLGVDYKPETFFLHLFAL